MSAKGKRKRSHSPSRVADKMKPTCVFCKSSVKNKYWLGKMMTVDGLTAHYHCILFSPAIEQNGTINEGFKGFLKEDIMKEVRRGGRLYCSYCGHRGAVIGCVINSCNIKFHLNCGIVNNSFHQFHDPDKSYPSYCSVHRPSQKVARVGQQSTADELCVICREEVERKPTYNTLWSPCCGNWLHRGCIVQQAYHAGKHHFKCPKCNDKDKFVPEMKKFGVNVPTRDASWEKGLTYQEMYEKNLSCYVENCQSRKGRQYNGDNEWELILCDGCGANSTHIRCGRLPIDVDAWLCNVCRPILNDQLN